MARTFKRLGHYATGDACLFGATDSASYSISLMPNPFTCCGLSSLTGFGRLYFDNFGDQAAFIAGLSELCQSGRTHVVYVVNPTQARGSDHKTMLKAGAKSIAKFPNLQPGHGGYDLEMFMWNPADAVGVFVDKTFQALSADPSVVLPPPEVPAVPAVKRVRPPKATIYE